MKTKNRIHLWQEKLSLWGILALAIMSVIVPLMVRSAEYQMWVGLSSNIGIALFSALSISKFLQKETKDLIFDEIPLLQKANEIGVVDFPENGSLDKLNLMNSKNLTVVMNDGKFFISQNAGKLCNRFEDSGTTTFIFLDEESDVTKSLCIANGKDDEESYKNKIKQSIKDVKKYSENYPHHKFEIYLYSKGYFRTSVILTDTQAMVGTYRNSPGKRQYPIHILISKKGNEFSAIRDDVEELKKLSRKLILQA